MRKLLVAVLCLGALVMLTPASADVFPFEIRGTVRNALGEPLEGARVSDGSQSQVTGADGRYLFKVISPSSYVITASKTGFVDDSIFVQVPLHLITSDTFGLTSQDLELLWTRRHSLNSTVIDTSSAPFTLVYTASSEVPDPEVRSCAYVMDGSTTERITYVGVVEGRNTWEWSKVLPQNSPDGKYQVEAWMAHCETGKKLTLVAEARYTVTNSQA